MMQNYSKILFSIGWIYAIAGDNANFNCITIHKIPHEEITFV